MKISASINAANTNLTAITNKKTVTNSFGGDKRAERKGRFDTFTMIGDGQKKPNSLSAEKTSLIRNLDGFSEEEKAEVAVASYIQLQKCCKSALDRYETDVDSFKSLREEKAYYNELKSRGGVISEEGGKYAFSESNAGSVIGEKEIDAALSEVQERINRFVAAPTEETAKYEATDKIFRSAAQLFSKAAGISDEGLNLDDDSLCKYREGLTEENYLEKTGEAIESINDRSQRLKNVMSDYTGKNAYAKELTMNPDKLLKKDENGEKSDLAELLEQLGQQPGAADTPDSELIADLFSERDE